ncbi:MAG: HPP family protein [Proteobacteria bacterium]|nr:HPP family protein [Pseudomonadota bacterium]
MRHPFLLRAWLGAALSLGVALLLTEARDSLLLLASLGGSCVILFGSPDGDMAQPRSLFGGHLVGTLSGLVFFHAFGPGWWVMASAMASALVVMLLTDTIHSPAGADPLIVIADHASWNFLWNPVAIGVAVLFVGALLANNLRTEKRYPRRWW